MPDGSSSPEIVSTPDIIPDVNSTLSTPVKHSHETIRQQADELGIRGIDTNRDIDGYVFELGFTNEEEFIAYIDHKNVCDVGSGYGGLAVESKLRDIDVKVTSINPSISRPEYKNKQINQMIKDYSEEYPKEQIMEALTVHDSQSYAAFAHEIPLPDSSQDVVLDSMAVTYYADRLGPELYKKSIEEMMRILKPGGKLRIGAFNKYGDKDKSWEEQMLINLGLEYEICKDEYENVMGVEIVKPTKM